MVDLGQFWQRNESFTCQGVVQCVELTFSGKGFVNFVCGLRLEGYNLVPRIWRTSNLGL